MSSTQLRHRRDIILATKGSIFGAVVKTRRGDIRRFNAKTFEGTGSERDTKNGMLTVMELNNLQRGEGSFRTIALEGLREIHFGKQTIKFE